MLRGMAQHNQRKLQSKTGRHRAVAPREANHSDLLESLKKYRLDQDLSWRALGDLCGIDATALLRAVRRGMITDRLAARIERKIGDLLGPSSVQVGASRA
jgi:hypothetical protein